MHEYNQEVRERITHIYILVMLFIYPLFTGFGPEGYIYLNEKKYLFFVVCTGVWVTAICAYSVVKRKCKKPCSISRIDILIIASMVTAFIATQRSEWPAYISMWTGRCDGLLTYLLYGCILFGVSRYGRWSICCVYVFSAAYGICCLIALLQLMGYNALWLYPNGLCYWEPFVQETGAFLGTTGNVDLLSALHCATLPLMVGVLFCSKEKFRWWLVFPVCMGVVCMAVVPVDSGWLALGMTVLIAIPFVFANLLPRFNVSISKKKAFSCGTFFAIGSMVVVLFVVYFGSWDNHTTYELQQMLHGEVQDSFGSNRIRIWKRALEVIWENPLLGIGPDNFGRVSDIVFQRYSETLGDWIVNGVDNVHNEYLQYLVNFGLVGWLPVMLLWGGSWYVVLKEKMFEKEPALCLSLLCYCIQAFFNIGTCIIVPIFLIEWAMLLRVIQDQQAVRAVR